VTMVEHILSFIFNFILNLPWGIIATIFASFSPIAIYQYYRRPKPVTGVLPWDEVQKNGLSLEELGNPSTEDEIMFALVTNSAIDSLRIKQSAEKPLLCAKNQLSADC